MFRLACARGCAHTGVLRVITTIDGGTRDVTVRVARSTATVTSVSNRIKILVASPRGRHGIVEDYVCILELAGPNQGIPPRIAVLARDFEAILKIIPAGVIIRRIESARPLVCRGVPETRRHVFIASARGAAVLNMAKCLIGIPFTPELTLGVVVVYPRVQNPHLNAVIGNLIRGGTDLINKTFRSFR